MLRAALPDTGPGRVLALSTLVNTVGNGLYLTGGAVFLTRSAGLPASQVGLGLTVGGLLGLVGGVVIGDHADRRGVRQVYVTCVLAEAAAMAVFLAVHEVGLFLVAASVGAIGQAGSQSVRGATIALIGGPEGRVRLRAQLRVLSNLGISVGALLAGVALAADTHAAYVALIAGNTLTFLASAALALRLPRFAATRRGHDERSRWIAVKDHRFLAVTGLNGVLSVQYRVLTLGVPLWITLRTDAPQWTIAALLLLNTAMVIALQIPASTGIVSAAAAGRAMRRSGVAFLVAWAAIAGTRHLSATGAVAVLAVAVAIHTVGELWEAAASFELGFALADPDAQGQYQGIWSISVGLSEALGPVIITAACIGLGAVGWILLGAAVAAAGAAGPVAVRWASADRAGAQAAGSAEAPTVAGP